MKTTEEYNCTACIFKSDGAKTLAESEQELLSCNHLTIKFKKGDAVIRE